MWLESGQRTYTTHSNATECISMQCNVVKCNPKQCSALQCDVMEDSACDHCEAMCIAMQGNIMQDGAHVNAVSNPQMVSAK